MTPPTDNELTPLGPTAQAPFAEDPDEALSEIFGHDSFLEGQRRVVEHLAGGDDALVVMPTGAGKSLCYQLAGALVQGVTLVVSPLIALMKDQVDSLEATGLPATAINSSMSWAEQQGRIDGMYMGDYKIVYIAPERFRSPKFCKALEDVQIGLFAVDEAHCISQWGHDFRPDYRRLAEVRERFGSPQTVALTATATEFVREDILRQLDIEDAEVLQTGFERPNLYFEVFHAQDKSEKIDRMEALIRHWAGESVIVYVATRKQVDAVRNALEGVGIETAGYHGGVSRTDRPEIQERWMNGEVDVMVATNAFGMGVDKKDVRAVIHYNIPGSIEAYYQEAGRAGRDGKPAHCLLLFNRNDTGIHEWFADNTHPLRMELIRIWMHLRERGPGEFETSPKAISKRNPGPGDTIHPMAVETCLKLLSRAGHINWSGGTVEVVDDVDPLELDVETGRLGERRRVAKQQVSEVVEYTSSSECFQAALLSHFDSRPSFGSECGHCATCDPPPGYVETQAERLTRNIVCERSPEEVVQTVLRGVAKADGRRGPSLVAGMLVGSRARAVQKAGFRKLDTYGALSELTRKDATYLIELVGRHGLVRRDDHGCVLLTSRGVDAMKGGGFSAELTEALSRDFVSD